MLGKLREEEYSDPRMIKARIQDLRKELRIGYLNSVEKERIYIEIEQLDIKLGELET